MTVAAVAVGPQTEPVACALCGPGPVSVVTTHDRYGLPTRIVQCETCDLRFISPRMSAEAYAAFYRDGYRPLLQSLERRLNQRVTTPAMLTADQWAYARDLMQTVAPWMPPQGTLLDLGGSTGIVGRAFRARWGYDVTVVDPSPGELAQATGCRTLLGSAETVDLPAVDVALVCRTVDHLLDPVGVLRRLRARVLVIDAMDVDFWPTGSQYKVDHPYAFTRDTLRRLVVHAGWTIRHEWTRRHRKYVGLVCSPQEAEHGSHRES